MADITAYNPYANEITEHCVSWCREQHFANDLSGIWIIFMSFISIVASKMIIYWHDYLEENTDMAAEKLEKLYHFLNDLSMYLMIGFFIWFIWVM